MLDEVDEAFLASTRVECLPIARVDGRAIGSSSATGFPRATALRAAFGELVQRETVGTAETSARGART
jgi:hypothetical protein